MSSGARTLFEKIWDSHVVEQAPGRHLPPLHRPPPRPRGDEPAGLRGAARSRPQGAPARPDAGRAGPQRPDDRPLAADRGRDLAHPGRDPGSELRGVRRPAARHARRPPGHRPRHRPRAGLHPAGHDDRLRRQPHQHARRLRRPRLRHRHVRGRARAGDADAGAEAPEDDADQRRGRAAAGLSRPRT